MGNRGGASITFLREAVVNLRRASRAINERDTAYVTESRGRVRRKKPPSIFVSFAVYRRSVLSAIACAITSREYGKQSPNARLLGFGRSKGRSRLTRWSCSRRDRSTSFFSLLILESLRVRNDDNARRASPRVRSSTLIVRRASLIN